ncbi:MAG: hypothetical protein AB7G28_17760 [Pirellulales bacterium]
MKSRALIILAVGTLLLVGPTQAQSADALPAVGDHLFIDLTGKLAQEYVKRMDVPSGPLPGLSISTTATIEQRLTDGKYRISHHTRANSAGRPRLITLTAVVDPSQITTAITPANTLVYASPAVQQAGGTPALTKSDQNSFRVELSSLKGVKLQTWELVEEVGE